MSDLIADSLDRENDVEFPGQSVAGDPLDSVVRGSVGHGSVGHEYEAAVGRTFSVATPGAHRSRPAARWNHHAGNGDITQHNSKQHDTTQHDTTYHDADERTPSDAASAAGSGPGATREDLIARDERIARNERRREERSREERSGGDRSRNERRREERRRDPNTHDAIIREERMPQAMRRGTADDTSAQAAGPSPLAGPVPEKASLLNSLLAPPGVLGALKLSETQREPAFRDELLTMYRQRLRLLGLIAMIALPACIPIYAWLLPSVLREVVPVYTVLFIYALLMRTLVGTLQSLTALRLTTLASYACFSMGAAVVIALIGDHNPLLYSSHTHIILSALLLPFTVWECGVIATIVVGSLAWAGWWSLPKEQTSVYASYLYLLCTTSVFVLCVTHFQSLLRRNAFDAAFDLVRSNDKLQTLSLMDTLTGGYNRRYLEQTLAVEIARAARFNRPLSVMMFDLDNFKAVNDTRGHAAGDEVLREVWQAALGALREVDAAARYGGDEFSIVLPETDEADAQGVAERLQAAVRYRLHARFGAESPEGNVTVSVGIVTTRPGEAGAPTPDRLIDSADERLYEAKRRGKNRIAI